MDQRSGQAYVFLNTPKALRAGVADVWGITGCVFSHIAALEKARVGFESGAIRQAIVLEDDAQLSHESAAAQINATISKLTDRYSSWDVLQLGGVGVRLYAKRTRHCRVGVRGVRRAEAVWQAHAYVIRSAKTAQDLIDRMRRGQTPDGAMVSHSREHMCFWCDPPLMVQQGSPSDTIEPSAKKRTWEGALKASTLPRGKTRCWKGGVTREVKSGRGRVSMKVARQAAQRIGSVGGSRLSGNGSSQKVVRKKEAKIRAFWDERGRTPHRWEVPGVSYKVWSRVVKELQTQL